MAERSIFTDQDLTVENYRSFSGVSLMLFLLAMILGFTVLVNKNLIILNLIIIGLMIIFLIFQSLSRQKHSGVWLAHTGMFLLTVMTISSYAYHDFRVRHLSQVAVSFADDFFELVKENRMHEAYEMSLHYDFRSPVGTDLIREYGTNENPNGDFKVYLVQEPEKSIRQQGAAAKLKRTGNVVYENHKVIRERFTMEYRLDKPDSTYQVFEIALIRMDYPLPEPAGLSHLFHFVEGPGPQWFVEGILNTQPAIRRTMSRDQMELPDIPNDL